MKIIKDNFTLSKNSKGENFPLKITCEKCKSVFELDENEITIGVCGLYETKEKCPCCGENIIIYDGIDLTIDTVEYPTHFYKYDGVKIDDNEINKQINDILKKLEQSNDINDWVRFMGTGNTIIFVFKMQDEYEIYVCKDYESVSFLR